MCSGRGPIMDMFEKNIEAMVKQGYLDQKEDINLKQVTFLTKDGLKTVQATACKAKKALVAVGKKNRENKKKLEESLARGNQLESDILLYEFRQQQHYRKSVHYVEHALGLLAEGKSENFLPALALLNEFWAKGGQLVGAGLTKAAGTKLGANIMKKMMKRGGFGSKTAWKALKGTAAQQVPIGGWKMASKKQLKQVLKDRGVKLTGRETKEQLVKKMKGWRPGKQLAQNKTARLATKAQKKAAKKAAKEEAKRRAAREGTEEVSEGFFKNLSKGRIGKALKVFCKKNKWTCRGLGIYAAISVIGNVIGPEDLSSSSEVDAEQQRLLDAMDDKQLKGLCDKGNQAACTELKVRESDREAGRLPRTPNSGIGGQGAAGADQFAGSHNKKGSRVLGMSVKWIEKRGWKYMPANDDYAKPGRPNYWLKRDHCKGTKYCSNRGKGRKKIKVTKSEPIMSKDVAVTGVGGAEFGPGTSGMSPITLTNPNTGEVEGLTRAGQKAMQAPLPADVLKAREEYERSLKESK